MVQRLANLVRSRASRGPGLEMSCRGQSAVVRSPLIRRFGLKQSCKETLKIAYDKLLRHRLYSLSRTAWLGSRHRRKQRGNNEIKREACLDSSFPITNGDCSVSIIIDMMDSGTRLHIFIVFRFVHFGSAQ